MKRFFLTIVSLFFVVLSVFAGVKYKKVKLAKNIVYEGYAESKQPNGSGCIMFNERDFIISQGTFSGNNVKNAVVHFGRINFTGDVDYIVSNEKDSPYTLRLILKQGGEFHGNHFVTSIENAVLDIKVDKKRIYYTSLPNFRGTYMYNGSKFQSDYNFFSNRPKYWYANVQVNSKTMDLDAVVYELYGDDYTYIKKGDNWIEKGKTISDEMVYTPHNDSYKLYSHKTSYKDGSSEDAVYTGEEKEGKYDIQRGTLTTDKYKYVGTFATNYDNMNRFLIDGEMVLTNGETHIWKNEVDITQKEINEREYYRVLSLIDNNTGAGCERLVGKTFIEHTEEQVAVMGRAANKIHETKIIFDTSTTGHIYQYMDFIDLRSGNSLQSSGPVNVPFKYCIENNLMYYYATDRQIQLNSLQIDENFTTIAGRYKLSE